MEEKGKMFAWGKTLLMAYKYLETVTNAIDDLVKKQSINSCFYSNGYYNSTYNFANKIINLTDRKQKLINVKILVEDALSKLPTNDVRLLVLTYFDLLKSTVVSETLNISLRTFFRRKKQALTKFANALKLLGFSDSKLSLMLSSEGWLINIYQNNLNSISESENSDDILTKAKEYKLLKYIIKDLNSTSCKSYSY